MLTWHETYIGAHDLIWHIRLTRVRQAVSVLPCRRGIICQPATLGFWEWELNTICCTCAFWTKGHYVSYDFYIILKLRFSFNECRRSQVHFPQLTCKKKIWGITFGFTILSIFSHHFSRVRVLCCSCWTLSLLSWGWWSLEDREIIKLAWWELLLKSNYIKGLWVTFKTHNSFCVLTVAATFHSQHDVGERLIVACVQYSLLMLSCWLKKERKRSSSCPIT